MQTLTSLFLCGDAMLGRGVDQILPHPGGAALHETYVRDARRYVEIAEEANGRIDRPVGLEYVWGDALAELERAKPAARIVNLETAITTSDDAWPGKGIHYRMHPLNAPVLTAARIDCCVLANNHVLDWGYAGLTETTRTLNELGVATAGAGADEGAASAPAVLPVHDGHRVLVFAYGAPSGGVPRAWAAEPDKAGVNHLPTLSEWMVESVAQNVEAHARPGDLVVFSVHWGGNWGYDVPADHVRFAHALIDEAGVDIVHGHSSHHPLGLEVYKERLIVYGCGDFLNDYEGIGGKEGYRPELTLMYFPTLDPATGQLVRLRLVPMHIRRMRLGRAAEADAHWLSDMLNRESERFDTSFGVDNNGDLHGRWGARPAR